MATTAKTIANILLETKAVKLSPTEPFKWSSGWNSPIYCDNRVVLSYPEQRSYIKNSLAALVKEKFPEVEAIAGVATAGIAQGALVAEALELPFLYVRPKPKAHGMQNCIEGRLEKGQKVVLIEDLISTGGSSIKAALNVQNEGGEVLGIAAIFTYEFEAANNNSKEAGIPFHTLSGYTELMGTAVEKGIIPETSLEKLAEWREKPESWSA